MELVVIKTYNNYIDANFSMAYLKENGVKCSLFDENISTIIPFTQIKLVVPKEEVDTALLLLSSFVDRAGE